MVELLKEGMNSSKDEVCGLVLASEIPPSLDDSFVIAVDFKASARASKPGDCPDEELKPDGFCSTNVASSVQGLPARDKPPGSPSVADSDGNADARTCI